MRYDTLDGLYRIIILGHGKNRVYYKVDRLLESCYFLIDRIRSNTFTRNFNNIITKLITANRIIFCSERHLSNRSYGKFDFNGKLKQYYLSIPDH